VAYSAKQVLLNKPQIYGGPAKLDCYRPVRLVLNGRVKLSIGYQCSLGAPP